MRVNCILKTDSTITDSGFQAHFQPYFIKRVWKPTKFYNDSFDSVCEIPAGALYLRFCWAFLCRHGIRFLVGPSYSRMGKRPAFFVLGCHVVNLTPLPSLNQGTASHAKNVYSPQVRHVPFRLPQSLSFYRRFIGSFIQSASAHSYGGFPFSSRTIYVIKEVQKRKKDDGYKRYWVSLKRNNLIKQLLRSSWKNSFLSLPFSC